MPGPVRTPNDEKEAVQAEQQVATLTMPDGRVVELPVLLGADSSLYVDIRKLLPSTGICTFDPGFGSTASCESSITFIDGNKGILLYRGYPIEELAAEGDFMDAAYLLLHGELPGRQDKALFESDIKHHTLVHEQLIQFYKGFQHNAHPMAIMCGVVGALAAFYPEVAEVRNPAQQMRACYRLVAKMPTLAAMAYKTSCGQPIIYPRNDLTYAENFLHMMFAVPCERYEVDPELARALEIIMVLHLDHEQNASTSTVRTAGSSQANPFACVASGIAALWGPAHGGANEAVLHMLQQIQDLGGVEAIPKIMERAKDKKDTFRLMGFGHRVYKTFDPRATLMRSVTYRVLERLGIKDPLLDIAMELERVALQDEYFVKRSLYPNVDFYSGIVLRALGIPLSMYTVLFAMARTVGWVSQWKEMVNEPVNRITRPRQIYTGVMRRKFVPTMDRPLSTRAPGSPPYCPSSPPKGGAAGGANGDVFNRSSLMARLVSTHARTALR